MLSVDFDGWSKPQWRHFVLFLFFYLPAGCKTRPKKVQKFNRKKLLVCNKCIVAMSSTIQIGAKQTAH